MPKRAYAENSTCRKEHMPKRAHADKSTFRKEHMPKRANAKKSTCRKLKSTCGKEHFYGVTNLELQKWSLKNIH